MPAARIRPCSDSWAPRHRFFTKELSPDGRMDRRSELPRFTAPARHDACAGWESAFRDDLYGTDVGDWQELFARGVHNNSLLLLSCAA